MNLKSLVLPFLIGLLIFETDSQNMKPKEAIEHLSFMVGDWTIKSEFINDEDKWENNPNGKARIRYDLDSLALFDESDFLFNGRLYHTKTLIGYDSQRGVYRFMIMDNLVGFPDVHQGRILKKKLVVTNSETGTAFIQDGKPTFYRSTYQQINATKFSMKIESSKDTKIWKLLQSSIYIKE